MITTTIVGTDTVVPMKRVQPDPTQPPTFVPDPSRPILTGQVAVWAGTEGNPKNFSQGLTANFQGVAPDGTAYSYHENYHESSGASNPFVDRSLVIHIFC